LRTKCKDVIGIVRHQLHRDVNVSILDQVTCLPRCTSVWPMPLAGQAAASSTGSQHCATDNNRCQSIKRKTRTLQRSSQTDTRSEQCPVRDFQLCRVPVRCQSAKPGQASERPRPSVMCVQCWHASSACNTAICMCVRCWHATADCCVSLCSFGPTRATPLIFAAEPEHLDTSEPSASDIPSEHFASCCVQEDASLRRQGRCICELLACVDDVVCFR
jgi:hypothetical protein